jgi:hypothetical protein
LIVRPQRIVRAQWPLVFDGHMENAAGRWTSLDTTGTCTATYEAAAARSGSYGFRVVLDGLVNARANGRLTGISLGQLQLDFCMRLANDFAIGSSGQMFVLFSCDTITKWELMRTNGAYYMRATGQGTAGTPIEITKGVWSHLKLIRKIETGAGNNGVCEAWVDGVPSLATYVGARDDPATAIRLGAVAAVDANTINGIDFDDIRVRGK